jgi:hypothetical protein
MLGSSLIAAQLAVSQEGLSSVSKAGTRGACLKASERKYQQNGGHFILKSFVICANSFISWSRVLPEKRLAAELHK